VWHSDTTRKLDYVSLQLSSILKSSLIIYVMKSSSPGSSPDTGGNTCTAIHNCPRDPVRGLAWTCLLGKTCGFSYNQCNPCPYIGTGVGSGEDSSDNGPSGSETSSSSDSTPSGGSSGIGSSGSDFSATISSSSPSVSTSSSGISPSSSSTPVTSSGCRSKKGALKLHFIAAFSFGVLVVGIW